MCRHEFVTIYDTGTRYQMCAKCGAVRGEHGKASINVALSMMLAVYPAFAAWWVLARCYGQVVGDIAALVVFVLCTALFIRISAAHEPKRDRDGEVQ